MIFLQGLWHSAKVLSAALYWLLTLCLVWAGFALMGTAPNWAWANFAVALGMFAARGLSKRWLSVGASYVAAFAVIIVYLLIAAQITGYGKV